MVTFGKLVRNSTVQPWLQIHFGRFVFLTHTIDICGMMMLDYICNDDPFMNKC